MIISLLSLIGKTQKPSVFGEGQVQQFVRKNLFWNREVVGSNPTVGNYSPIWWVSQAVKTMDFHSIDEGSTPSPITIEFLNNKARNPIGFRQWVVHLSIIFAVLV